jgi:hypothetical protein
VSAIREMMPSAKGEHVSGGIPMSGAGLG